MISRVLPRKEWARLGGGFPELTKYVKPKDLKVVVVEDGEKIVATMGVLHLTFFECVEIDPEYRNAGVVRSLLRKSNEAASEWSEKWVFSGAASDEMRGILQRLDGKPLDMGLYVLPVKVN